MMPPYLVSAAKKLRDRVLDTLAHSKTIDWKPYSRLHWISDSSFWVISQEARELTAIAGHLGIRVAHGRWHRYVRNQAVFYGSPFFLLDDKWLELPHRFATAYFHGKPGTGVPEFDLCYRNLCRAHSHIHRVQVSHGEMRDVILESGIAPEKVFLIPIGINLSYFPPHTPESRRRYRMKYGIPQSATVIGSFQKDGEGWGEGSQPKLVKGPDIFLKTIEILKPRIPELFVLLSGPARGYVKAGLERLGVPYRHCFLRHYPQVGQLFQTLDLYIVASRQEGGPKAILESMAGRVPLVTTRVGQAMDLVHHGKNGWMVDVEDAEGLACWAEYVLNHCGGLDNVLDLGQQTARTNSYESQIPLWRDFMHGFVEASDRIGR